MGSSTELRIMERLDGLGRVYDGDQLVAEVAYSLKEIEEIPNDARSGGQDARMVEARTLCGLVTSPQLEALAPYPGRRLNFELQDGRRFDFSIARYSERFCLVKALGRVRG